MGEIFRATYDRVMRERRQAALQPLPPTDAPVGLDSAAEGTFDPNAMALPDARPGVVAKALKGLSLAYEPIDRATKAYREAILFAGGRTTRQGFQRRFGAALRGESDMSTRDFAKILIGSETYRRLEQTPAIPGWFADVTVPEHANGLRKPKLGVDDALTFGLEFAADPFALLSLTPAGIGVKFGSVARLAKMPFSPLFRGLEKAIGPGSNSPLSYLNFVRSPQDVLPEGIFQGFVLAKQAMENNTETVMSQAQALMKGVKYRSASDQKIGAWLHNLKVGPDGRMVRGATKLSDAERKVADSLYTLLDGQLQALSAAGVKLQSGARLEDFLPRLVGKSSIPPDILQSWNAKKLGRVHMRLTDPNAVLPAIKPNELSAADSVRDFVHAARRKLDLEPALLRYRIGANARERALEDPLTKSLSFFQRRYLTDWINVYTGNNRGRKQIGFDILVGDFYDRLSKTPVGKRVAAMHEKLGKHGLVDGNPDFSPVAKMTGVMSHNIIRSVLGGNLSSAIVNTTQILNFAVKRGLPETIQGLYKWSSPEMRLLRKEANLMRDFNSIWRDDAWVSKIGLSYDRVIFAPFQLAERVIRGTGFNIGAGVWMKKNGFKSIADVRAAGKLEDLVKAAHFESLDGAFIYGTLGRAPVFSNPALRPLTTLMSFGPKQAEFYRRAFVEDGSAFMRFVGMHGWAIGAANEHLNIAAEDFLGWGFTPMTKSFGGIPLMASPQVSLAVDLLEASEAYANNDRGRASVALKRVRDALPTALGANPLPWVGVKRDTQQLLEELKTQRRKLGEGFVPVAEEEAWGRFLVGRSTTDKMRSDLNRRIDVARKKVDFELDRRASAFVEATLGSDGDKLGEAAWAAAQGIDIEGKLFYPSAEQFDRRVANLMERKLVPADIIEMQRSGFLSSVFIWSQLELLHRVAEGQK